jgi:GcrA cell cycle regulator
MEWTEERVARLTELWTAGYSARSIAEILGSITRNAVIGKANRLGLSKPTKSSMTRARRRDEGEPAPREEPVAAGPEGGVSILTLTTATCRWPLGHPGEEDFRFCGARTRAGQPYCETHSRMAYQAPSKDARKRSA